MIFQQETASAIGLSRTVSHPSYFAAAASVARLEAVATDAIRSIRALCPDFRDLTGAELDRIIPGLPAGLGSSPCSPFRR